MRFELDFFCISFLKMHIKIYISKFIVSHNLFIYILQIKLRRACKLLFPNYPLLYHLFSLDYHASKGKVFKGIIFRKILRYLSDVIPKIHMGH